MWKISKRCLPAVRQTGLRSAKGDISLGSWPNNPKNCHACLALAPLRHDILLLGSIKCRPGKGIGRFSLERLVEKDEMGGKTKQIDTSKTENKKHM